MNLLNLFDQMEWILREDKWTARYRGMGSIYEVQCDPPVFDDKGEVPRQTQERRIFACRVALASELIKVIYAEDIPQTFGTKSRDPLDVDGEPKPRRRKKAAKKAGLQRQGTETGRAPGPADRPSS